MTKVVFLGTPQAAVPTLRALASSRDIALVITQPDRPRGRSKRPMPSPVKEAAIALSLPVAQPASRDELRAAIDSASPFALGVVVAYGRILGPDVLAIPERGFLNVHFSLLPRWRGAAPVARALIAGDPMTGVTIIRLDQGLDTGPVLTAQAVDISPGEDAGSLTERLASLGARLLSSTLDQYLEGRLQPIAQSPEGVTYADKLTSGDRPLHPDGAVDDFVNRVRGLAPEPAATLEIDGEPHKILAATPHDAAPDVGTWELHDGLPVVGLRDGGVALERLQSPGRRAQRGMDWARGRRVSGGTVGSGNTIR